MPLAVSRAVAWLSATVELARKEGFLCVISDLSTLRRPLVTASPLFSSEKTAPKPPGVGGAGADSVLMSKTGGGPGGGGGGGGGGGAPPAAGEGAGARVEAGAPEERDLTTSWAGWPLGFQGTPVGEYCFT